MELTSTSFALLGLLAVRPWTTYELAQQMDRGLASFWPRARSNLYAEPKRLVALGLATATTQQVGRRPRTVYRITPKGRRALKAWLDEQNNAAKAPPGQAGQAVFTSNGCAGCHTLKAANAKGTVGPDLDKLPAYAKQAGKPLEDFVRESIADPNAYVEQVYPKNLMPSFATLPKDQLDALVTFLVDSSKGGGS